MNIKFRMRLLVASLLAGSLSSLSFASELLFVSNQDGDREIFTVGIDGKKISQLTHNNRDDYMASWSPDGNRIAFVSARDGGNAEVYIMNADGSKQTNISKHSGFDGTPSWSADGKSLAFCSDRNGGINLFIYSFADKSTKQLTENQYESCYASWSPDGKWIAFRQFGANQKADLALIKPDGTDYRELTNNPKGSDGVVEWSPDSKTLLYDARRSKEFNIFTFNLETGEEKQLTKLNTIDSSPKWSKDGTKILFLSARDTPAKAESFLMDADGSNPINISKRGHLEQSVSWSSDHKYILLSSYHGRNYSNIYRMKPNGSELVQISAAKGYQMQPLARPVSPD